MIFGKAQVNGRGRSPPSTEDRICYRNLMEQCDLFAVFDGHSGAGVVRYTVEYLPRRIEEALKSAGPDILKNVKSIREILKRVFIEHDKDLAKNFDKIGDSGSTATVAIVTPTHVIVAYIGDSPCFLMDPATGLILPGGEMGKHEPTLASENARIKRAGGTVEIDEMGVARVDGLMVSRAFGDFSLKYPDMSRPPYGSDWTEMKVTAHPDIVVWDRPNSGLLALMSDGLVETETTTLKPLPQVAAEVFKALKDNRMDLPRTAGAAVKAHVMESIKASGGGSYDGDDLSIMLVDVGRAAVVSTTQTGGVAQVKQAVAVMTAKPKSRKMKGNKKAKTMKTNRIIKMFTVN
jgi:serine/threonine protein phosphatase PrpC